MIDQKHVHGAQSFERGIGEKAIGHRVDEFVSLFGGGVFVTRRRQAGVNTEAKGGQFSFVVHQTIRHVTTAVHIFRHVEPIMVSHGVEAFAEFPTSLFDVGFVGRNENGVLQRIGTSLKVQSGSGAFFVQLLFRTSLAANGTRVNEISGQGPVSAIVDELMIGQGAGWCETGFRNRGLNAGDDSLGVVQKRQSRVGLVPISLTGKFGVRGFALVIAQRIPAAFLAQIPWHAVESPRTEWIWRPGYSEAVPIGT